MTIKFWMVLLVCGYTVLVGLAHEEMNIETDSGTVHAVTDSDTDCEQWMDRSAHFPDKVTTITVSDFDEGLVMETASDSDNCYLRDITEKEMEDKGNCGYQIVETNATNSPGQQITDFILVTEGVSHANLTDHMTDHCVDKTVVFLAVPDDDDDGDGDDGDDDDDDDDSSEEADRRKRSVSVCVTRRYCYPYCGHARVCRWYNWRLRCSTVYRCGYRCYYYRQCSG